MRGRSNPHSDKTRANMRGTSRPNYKAERVGYRGLHYWVERMRPRTGTCQVCGATDRRTDNANLSGEYRRDLDDFQEMCRPCHRAHDQRRNGDL